MTQARQVTLDIFSKRLIFDEKRLVLARIDLETGWGRLDLTPYRLAGVGIVLELVRMPLELL